MMKSLNSFRMLLLVLWLATWLVMCALLLVADSLRGDQAIGLSDRLEGLLMLSPIWLTPLACFATFWFPDQERRAAQKGALTGTQKVAALIFTAPYLALVLILAWITIRADYPQNVMSPAAGESFIERVAKVVKFAGLLSPLALAPTLWITRTTKKSPTG